MSKTTDFFNTACDLSDKNGFTGNTLDRLGEQRDTLDFDTLTRHDNARFHIVVGHGQLVKSTKPFDAIFTSHDIQILGEDIRQAHLLGITKNGEPEFALGIAPREEFPDGMEAIDLRSAARGGVLRGQEIGAIAQARSLVAWHRNSQFCPKCGTKTKTIQAGYARRCEPCGITHFPRTDPVSIMLAVDGDRCLLGRSPHFPENMVSALAGFIEVGETVEEAVRREILEEAGITCRRVRYHSSQPWPFPSSLMIGCFAEATSTDIKIDDELDLCRWFTRDETRAILENTHPEGFWAPPETAIAHQLMLSFVEGM
ncbi:MAG: NAD(+) diphosphatase [Hyphomicrobiales bacterium]